MLVGLVAMAENGFMGEYQAYKGARNYVKSLLDASISLSELKKLHAINKKLFNMWLES